MHFHGPAVAGRFPRVTFVGHKERPLRSDGMVRIWEVRRLSIALWHDPIDVKWDALQAWRATFVAKHLREPRIWFDKACVDQNDIESDLRVLPLFLAGSNTLVVLFGQTFLARLWCVFEIFTFIHMGGRSRQINVLDLDKMHHQTFRERLASFDAQNSYCSVESDKQRLLAIIENAFGDLTYFNQSVQSLMCQEDGDEDDDENPSTTSFKQ